MANMDTDAEPPDAQHHHVKWTDVKAKRLGEQNPDWWQELSREALAAARDKARDEAAASWEVAAMFGAAYVDALRVIDSLVTQIEQCWYNALDQS